MKRIINNPDLVVEDAIQGYLKAFPQLFATTDHPRALKYPGTPVQGKVGIVTGGDSGHEPAFLGYVGRNMLDAVAIGEIFASPTGAAAATKGYDLDGVITVAQKRHRQLPQHRCGPDFLHYPSGG